MYSQKNEEKRELGIIHGRLSFALIFFNVKKFSIFLLVIFMTVIRNTEILSNSWRAAASQVLNVLRNCNSNWDGFTDLSSCL